jgi:hypothetical protein
MSILFSFGRIGEVARLMDQDEGSRFLRLSPERPAARQAMLIEGIIRDLERDGCGSLVPAG